MVKVLKQNKGLFHAELQLTDVFFNHYKEINIQSKLAKNLINYIRGFDLIDFNIKFEFIINISKNDGQADGQTTF